jgi:hypothetical protein
MRPIVAIAGCLLHLALAFSASPPPLHPPPQAWRGQPAAAVDVQVPQWAQARDVHSLVTRIPRHVRGAPRRDAVSADTVSQAYDRAGSQGCRWVQAGINGSAATGPCSRRLGQGSYPPAAHASGWLRPWPHTDPYDPVCAHAGAAACRRLGACRWATGLSTSTARQAAWWPSTASRTPQRPRSRSPPRRVRA